VGEQLGLACTAALNYASWPNATDPNDSLDIEMAKRALAEMVGYFVMGCAHGLLNVSGRVVALDADLRALLRSSKLRTDFPPFSEGQNDWKSLSMRNTDALRSVALMAKDPQVRRVGVAVGKLARSRAWKDLDKSRGEDFHRWRPQSAGIAGAVKQSPWKRIGKTGSHYKMSGGGIRVLGVDSAAKLAAEVFLTARRALDAVVDAMDGVDAEVHRAVPKLTGLRLGPMNP
jgi:hypothetical protein